MPRFSDFDQDDLYLDDLYLVSLELSQAQDAVQEAQVQLRQARDAFYQEQLAVQFVAEVAASLIRQSYHRLDRAQWQLHQAETMAEEAENRCYQAQDDFKAAQRRKEELDDIALEQEQLRQWADQCYAECWDDVEDKARIDDEGWYE